MKNSTLAVAMLYSAALQAQTVTVTTGPGNAQHTWYRLSDDQTQTVASADWDLAFEINGFTSSILVNTAKGDKIYNTDLGIEAWDIVTEPLVDTWTELNNSETDWAAGALTTGNNLSEPNGLDLGWGTYNMATHVVAGTELYVVQLVDGGTYKKLRIDALSTGTYTFTYANLDGTDERVGSLVKANYSGKNFGYWDMTGHAAADLEPLAADWDLLFTKYMSDLEVMWYGVTGVLQNKGVEVAQLDEVDPAAVDHNDAEGAYSAEMNIIGSDWKTFTGSVFEYVTDRVYFVRAVDGAIWKLVFTGYGGSATGDITFTKELMSATGFAEVVGSNGQVAVYPNPTSNGQVQVVADVPAAQALLTVIDMGGREVLRERLNGLNGFTARTLDVSALGQGTYVMRLAHANGIATSRLIVQ
jgi:hypothetical protein